MEYARNAYRSFFKRRASIGYACQSVRIRCYSVIEVIDSPPKFLDVGDEHHA